MHITGTPAMAISNPGARPCGFANTRAPAGTRTWRNWIGVTMFENRAAIRSRAASSTTGSTPASFATTSTVKSSSVGPNPPEHTTTSARPTANRSAVVISCSSSQQLVIQRVVMPRSHNRAASPDEFVSTISPRHSSSPMVKISACTRVNSTRKHALAVDATCRRLLHFRVTCL